MELLERVRLLAKRIEELDEEKKLIEEEIKDAVLFTCPTELTQEFIDYYYWETCFPVTSLAKALGVNNAAKLASPLKDVGLPCPSCGKLIYYEVSSKNNRLDLMRRHKKRLNPRTWTNLEEFVCPDCVKVHRAEAKKSKENKQDKDAQKRVKKYGKDMDLSGMAYSLFLRTEYWKKFAAYARKEAGYVCQDCGATNVPLHVHHLTYERRGKERLSDVKVLCQTCHELEHGRKFA